MSTTLPATPATPSPDPQAHASPFALHGRVALVTGGTRGIGLEIARGLAAAGARVAVCARTAEACAEVAAGIIGDGGDALGLAGHVGRPEDVARIVGEVVDEWGRLDILINNAGAAPEFGPLVDSGAQAFDKTFAVNVRGPLLLVGEAVRAWMGQHGGSIVNVSSIAGLKGEPFLGLYGASKAALINMTKTLAHELGPAGIRVNAVAPGTVATDFSRLITETPELRARVTGLTALKRIGQPRDVAGAVAWLASDAAAYVTGSVVVVDGGVLA
ncbi:MAG TPA: SDR family oxidoreductase [Euzebya sp.]|nr:SDR family oxidoreductase [Euzebya sp.]